MWRAREPRALWGQGPQPGCVRDDLRHGQIRSATLLPSSFQDVRNRIVEVRRYEPARAVTDWGIRDGVEDAAAVQAVPGVWRRGLLDVLRSGPRLRRRRRRLTTQLHDRILCPAESFLNRLKIGAGANEVLVKLPLLGARGRPTAGEEDRVGDRHGCLKLHVGQLTENGAKFPGCHRPVNLKRAPAAVYTQKHLDQSTQDKYPPG